jgi:hypothetical protein
VPTRWLTTGPTIVPRPALILTTRNATWAAMTGVATGTTSNGGTTLPAGATSSPKRMAIITVPALIAVAAATLAVSNLRNAVHAGENAPHVRHGIRWTRTGQGTKWPNTEVASRGTTNAGRKRRNDRIGGLAKLAIGTAIGTVGPNGRDATNSTSLRPAKRALAVARIAVLDASAGLSNTGKEQETNIGEDVAANSVVVLTKSLRIAILVIESPVVADLSTADLSTADLSTVDSAAADLAATVSAAVNSPGRAIGMPNTAGAATTPLADITGDMAALPEPILAGAALAAAMATQVGVGTTVQLIADLTGVSGIVVLHTMPRDIAVLATAVSVTVASVTVASVTAVLGIAAGPAGSITVADMATDLVGITDSCDTMRDAAVFIDGTGCTARHTRAARKGSATFAGMETEPADLRRVGSDSVDSDSGESIFSSLRPTRTKTGS